MTVQQSLRLLLIDDDAVDRSAVRRSLGRASLLFELVEASDGTSGLDKLRAQSFDCILLDYRLPDIDAFDMLEGLLAGGKGNNAIVILTGDSDQDAAARLMRAGALDYLTKSEMTPSTLSRAIRHACARRESLAELDLARQLAEEKTRQLQVLNDQKDLLFSIIAHDLRNPFQALLGLSELVRKATLRQDLSAVERYADGIHQSALRAAALMEGLFAWARSQLTTIEVSAETIDLAALVEEAMSTTAEAASGKKVVIRNECAGAVVTADPGMLAAVLRNLLNNAIKFSHAEGTVTVAVRQNGPNVDIAVRDEGVGIAEDTLKNLFRLDRRTTTPGTAGEPGSGLGLIICRNVVERMGGCLTVETKPGKGTTFEFALPGHVASKRGESQT